MPSIFTKTVKREPKNLPLQAPLNHEREATISIPHTHHRLLAEYIWPNAIIKFTHTQPNRTIFPVHVAGHRTVNFKATFTNLPDGLSFCQSGGPPCLRSITAYWKITKGESGAQYGSGSDAAESGDGEIWCLEESAEISFFRWVARYVWFSDVCHGMKMRKVLMLLERVLGGDAGVGVRGASN